ncbi:MAG: nitrite reductase small subunit NirD [Methylovulum sp.]|nr:nitrite reductase small subunit NirD [Methylovulum sp.]
MATWQAICDVTELLPNTGLCALLDGQQVAVFYVPDPELGEVCARQVYAISNFDPFGQANVLSRGICGDIDAQLVVASPLYKQHFNLRTGVCLENEAVALPVYAVRISQNKVELAGGVGL